MMRHFLVHYTFRKGINGPSEKRQSEITYDDIDPETTDMELKRMAANDVDQRFYQSVDYPLYGKFWQVIEVEDISY